jgi:queuine tRNA-ribosyltransferase
VKCGEILGPRLATIHNLHYYQQLMIKIREAIVAGELAALTAELRSSYRKDD